MYVCINHHFHQYFFWRLVGRSLRTRRRNSGAVELVTRELKFTSAQTEDIAVSEYGHLEIHETIEELMVVANSAVAQRIHAQFPTCALLRKHDQPPEEKKRVLKTVCEYLKIDVDMTNNYAFARSIQRVGQTADKTKRDMMMLLFRK